MSGDGHGAGRHPGDGDLVRLLDGEVDGAALREHVAGCSACRRRYRQLEERTRRVGRLLDAGAPLVREGDVGGAGADERGSAGRRSHGPSRWAKVAAVVLLLAGAGLAVGPVRAWVADQVERVVRTLGFDDGPGSAAVPRGASVSFTPEGRRLSIRVAALQRGGRLELATREGAGDVSGSVVSASGEARPGFTVLPSGLRIENGSSSRASYRVVVPASLEAVEVRIGDRRVARLTAEELRGGGPWRWRLGDGGGSAGSGSGPGG